MKKLLSVMAIFLMAAVVAFPPGAHAVPVLFLQDNLLNTVWVTDNQVGDSNLLAGVITFAGPLGGGPFIVNATTGVTMPVLGGPFHASMDVNSLDVSSSAAGGTLTIKFSEIGYNIGAPIISPNAVASMSIGGTSQGTTTYQAYFDNNNVQFGILGLIGTLGPYTPPSPGYYFSGGLTQNITVSPLFSLTEVFTITHPAGVKTTSFNAPLDLIPIPAPATLLLLGSGLLGLVGLRWRRARKES